MQSLIMTAITAAEEGWTDGQMKERKKGQNFELL